MNKTYNIERGSRDIIIKIITNVATIMATKLMACNLLIKCRKEEVPAGVVIAAAQCTNGTMLNWAPYLLNLFLDDCKDAQDLGTKLTIAQASLNFQVTSNMLQMDETLTQTPLKDLVQVELVMARIPTKALYKLQVSVAQEV
jgi:hypothetical protein